MACYHDSNVFLKMLRVKAKISEPNSNNLLNSLKNIYLFDVPTLVPTYSVGIKQSVKIKQSFTHSQ